MTNEEKLSYQKRRDTIIEVLSSLEGYWDLASGLRAFMESMHITPEVIDGVEKILSEAMTSVKDESAREKIQAGLDRIASMKALEAEERKEEQEKLSSMGFGGIL